MSSVAISPPEQGQLVSVRSRQWIINDVRPNALSSSIHNRITYPSYKLAAFFVSLRWETEFNASVSNNRMQPAKLLNVDEIALRMTRNWR